jgi:hypothetical protein
MSTLAQRSEELRETARARLLELLPARSLADRLEIAHGLKPAGPERFSPVFAFIRYKSRSGETRIVDFIVIRDNRPVSISGEINALLPTTERNFSIPPGEYYTGIVLGKKSPEDVVKDLSLLLFGQECLSVETL